MRTLALVALLALLAVGCGASPEFASTEFASTPNDEAAPPETATTSPHRPPSWPCAGSTGATRQQGRLSRHQSIEGFTSRACNQPATNAELDPRP